MKKYFIILAIFLLGFQTGFAQKVDKLFSSFSKEKNVDVVNVNETSFKFAECFDIGIRGIDGVMVLNLRNCSNKTKEKFAKEVSKLKDDRYETLIKANRENENVRIMIKVEDETVKELLIIKTGDHPKMVFIKGKIKQSDLAALIDNN